MRVDVIDRDYGPAEIDQPFSVCMTVKNEGDSIAQILNGILDQTLQPLEVVIVDGGSSDRTQEIIDGYSMLDRRFVLINKPGASPAEGRNIAARRALYDLQVMIDGGCVLDPKLFMNLVGPMCEDSAPEITSGIYSALVESEWSKYFIPVWANAVILQTSFLPSCRCCAIQRELIDRIGGFVTGLKQRWGEDTLFMREAKRLSSRWVINRHATMQWDAPKTFEEAKDLAYKYGMGNGEIGCDDYLDWYLKSNDPIVKAALDGYRKGCELRDEGTGPRR